MMQDEEAGVIYPIALTLFLIVGYGLYHEYVKPEPTAPYEVAFEEALEHPDPDAQR